MNIGQVNLNMLVYLDALLRTKNVTKAANEVGITQPAMSNVLKRLRYLFNDAILVRSSQGMEPTRFALDIHPQVQSLIGIVEELLIDPQVFDPKESRHVFRIAVSDYVESTLIPSILSTLREAAPNITLDLLTPSDVTLQDLENGAVDMIINRFDNLPQSFYQKKLWEDNYICAFHRSHALNAHYCLSQYLSSKHIWVSKTGIGSGERMEPSNAPRLGWVDRHVKKMGYRRNIALFTRHYQSALLLAQGSDLVVTLPSRATTFCANNANLIIKNPPFEITPIEIKMAWSPKLHDDKPHKWLRGMISQQVDF